MRALTRLATPETETKLLEAALYTTGAQLERLCRGYRIAMTVDNAVPPPERSLLRRDLPGGLVKLEIVLTPDEADLVMRALDSAGEVTHEKAEDGRVALGGYPPRATRPLRRVACGCALVAVPPAAPAAISPRPATRLIITQKARWVTYIRSYGRIEKLLWDR